jgi:hypothetical protein
MNAKAKEVEVTEVHGITAKDIEGLDKNAAAKYLIIDRGLELSQVNKVWSAFGSRSVQGGIAKGISDFLSEKPRTEKELADYLLDQTHSSPNAVRWFSMHNATRILANAIFAQFEVKITEASKTEAQVKEMAALVKTVTKK